jgi:hypothetical protein
MIKSDRRYLRRDESWDEIEDVNGMDLFWKHASNARVDEKAPSQKRDAIGNATRP